MKQLARTAVYWHRFDKDIMKMSCMEHQNKPEKLPVHPWMIPEEPWCRLHIDHAINFMGINWLVLVDAYIKYPSIYPTSFISAKTTTDLLEIDFAHFEHPHTIVTDNGPNLHRRGSYSGVKTEELYT